MTRLRKRDLQFRGEITAFLSLIFFLMLSLISALLSSASIYARKSGDRARMELGLESVFAEYNREMLETYDLFVRADSDEKEILKRLHYYGNGELVQELTEWELLTDHYGLPYYQAAVRYVKDWIGLEAAGPKLEESVDVEVLEEQTKQKLDDLLNKEEQELLEEGNPLSHIENLKKSNLLSILVTDRDQISNRSVELESLPSHRTLQKGNGEAEVAAGTEKGLFAAYLQEHFLHALKAEKETALAYEQEYILCGKASDKANLEQVLQKILMIRMGVNYAYLQTDETRKGEAAALATVLCALTTTPGMIEAVKQALLLAWAYGESILDLRVLMRAEKVPAIKNTDNWQMKLSNLWKLGTDREENEQKEAERGLSYTDYLTGLLLLESRETLCMRSLDLIEVNLSVQVDRCMTKAVVTSENHLRQGIADRFQTEFYYK